MTCDDWQRIKDMLDYGAYTEGDLVNMLRSITQQALKKPECRIAEIRRELASLQYIATSPELRGDAVDNAGIAYAAELTEELEELNKQIGQTDEQRIANAITVAFEYGWIDGAHHKAWVIDQMLRILSGDKYSNIIADACDGEDGPNTYEWDIGIAP